MVPGGIEDNANAKFFSWGGGGGANKVYYHSKQIFLPFLWPRAHHVTSK